MHGFEQTLRSVCRHVRPRRIIEWGPGLSTALMHEECPEAVIDTIEFCPKYYAIAQRECRRVLDPVMGSGTTLEAAKQEGAAAVGIEIEERWCEVAAKRLAQGVFNTPNTMVHSSCKSQPVLPQ